MDPLYYESHVTVEPVFDEKLERFVTLCAPHGFKVAKLLMQKGAANDKDSFCTAHAKDLDELKDRMMTLVSSLQENEFTVYRYKIEAVVFDVRLKARNS
jgi:hypothetical protein